MAELTSSITLDRQELPIKLYYIAIDIVVRLWLPLPSDPQSSEAQVNLADCAVRVWVVVRLCRTRTHLARRKPGCDKIAESPSQPTTFDRTAHAGCPVHHEPP